MKNLTKKLSLLIALCMIVTVGGVYATWVYDSTTTTNSPVEPLQLAMQDEINNTGTSGYIEARANWFGLYITHKKHAAGSTVGASEAGDFKAELEITGSMLVLYTDFVGNASSQLQYIVSYGNPDAGMTYNDVDIFKLGTSPQTITLTKIEDYTAINSQYSLTGEEALDSDDVGKYYGVITAESLTNMVSLNDFTLDTLNKYNEFQTKLLSNTLTIVISDASTATMEP